MQWETARNHLLKLEEGGGDGQGGQATGWPFFDSKFEH